MVASADTPSGLSVKEWVKLAETNFNQQNWTVLEAVSTRFSIEHPKEGKAFGYLGISLIKMNRITEAEGALGKGTVVDPSFIGNWYNLALIRAEMNRSRDLITNCLDHLAAESPENALALISNELIQKILSPSTPETLDLGKVAFKDHPKPEWKKVPPYPAAAKSGRIQGSVWVEILVDNTGRVVQVNNPTGPKELVSVAPYCAVQFRFPPLIRDGSPKAYKMLYEIPFKLR